MLIVPILLNIRTSNLTNMFPGTVETWPLKISKIPFLGCCLLVQSYPFCQILEFHVYCYSSVDILYLTLWINLFFSFSCCLSTPLSANEIVLALPLLLLVLLSFFILSLLKIINDDIEYSRRYLDLCVIPLFLSLLSLYSWAGYYMSRPRKCLLWRYLSSISILFNT